MSTPRPAPDEGGLPVWPVFADAMAGLAGLVVLLFVWAVLSQIDLTQQLEHEKVRLAEEQTARAREAERRSTLERALGGLIGDGRVTLDGARVSVRGSVLFPLASADLSEEGRILVAALARPLAEYADRADAVLLVSGFTDDLALHEGGRFADNWELSSQRALTVTRVLAENGFPSAKLVAAGFGEHHPAVPNETEAARAKNRRVELVPVASLGSMGRAQEKAADGAQP